MRVQPGLSIFSHKLLNFAWYNREDRELMHSLEESLACTHLPHMHTHLTRRARETYCTCPHGTVSALTVAPKYPTTKLYRVYQNICMKNWFPVTKRSIRQFFVAGRSTRRLFVPDRSMCRFSVVDRSMHRFPVLDCCMRGFSAANHCILPFSVTERSMPRLSLADHSRHLFSATECFILQFSKARSFMS